MSDSVRVAGSPEERFVVIGSLPGGVGLEVTAGNHTVSAAAVTQFWRDRGAVADWQLRADLAHSRPVLLLTRPASVSRVTHATELVPGKPAASHTETLCGMVLDWPGGLRICSEYEGWTPCPGCIARLAELVA